MLSQVPEFSYTLHAKAVKATGKKKKKISHKGKISAW